METKEKVTYCKRCCIRFECRANDIANCHCNNITISKETTAFLKTTLYDCLCSNCIKEVDALVVNHPERIAPTELIEGVHYYKEGPYFVFTELYHYLKNKCCGNNCRHCAYGNSAQAKELSFKKNIIVLLSIFSLNYSAQIKDSLIHNLVEVTIESSKQQQFQPTKKTLVLDSSILQKYQTTSIADLLTNQSTVHIKSYGNGNIATTSMRGGNANHTALLWNGLNIQNATLGQTDLSILPTLFFDKVSLEYGSGSALNGSGAIGGTIHLANKTQFNKGFSTALQLSTGSFKTNKISTSIVLSYKKIVSQTRIYYTQSKNNYKYIDTTDKENSHKQITHANFLVKGLMQELSFLINKKQTVNVRAWYNDAFRNLPIMNSVNSKQNQEDKNLKLNADWNYVSTHFNSIFRVGYLKDKLNYTDSIANIYSKSQVNTIILESDNVYRIKNQSFNFGVNFTQNQTDTSNFSYAHYLTKFALFVAYQNWLIPSKLNLNLAIRKEYTNQNKVPFTGNVGVVYNLPKNISAKVNASSSFRQPTLNDLYYNPGGNTHLKPEESYEFEGGLVYKLSKSKFQLSTELSYFNRHTKNWIIWLPTASTYWSPTNIAEVYSRGTETKTDFNYTIKKVNVHLLLSTSYVLSTNQKLINENDQSVGRQLIYTPRYSGNGGLSVDYKNMSILFHSTYTGYRFTTTDNTSWLNPYLISNIKASYTIPSKTNYIKCFVSINNIFNKNYQVIANRPMPLRNFEIGLTINYHKPNKQKTIQP